MAHILIPTDFSEIALKAAAFAVDLFGASGNTFTLVHAYAPIGSSDPLVPSLVHELQQARDEDLVLFEQRLRRKCDLSGAEVRRIMAFGPLADVVDETARAKDLDLVVMASGERSGSSHFGSNTTDVIQGALVPVLEIPSGVTALTIRRILFADDRHPIEQHTLDILATIARNAQAEVIIAQVATGRPSGELTDNTARLEGIFTGIRHRTVMVENDDVEEALFKLAEREGVDLIAMIHRHAGLWHELFHSSTTGSLALHSRIPVLALEQQRDPRGALTASLCGTGLRKHLLGEPGAVEIGRLIKDGATILDIRTDDEFASGHVPGALHIPLNELLHNLSRIPRDRPVVTCNANDALSATAAEILGAHGFKAYDGGGWATVARFLEKH